LHASVGLPSRLIFYLSVILSNFVAKSISSRVLQSIPKGI
jgi:hypothetical protein